MAAIDIGSGAIDRGAATGAANYTRIDLNNPADGTGRITSCELWMNTNGTGVKFGTFYGSGTDYTSRDVETIGAVTSGSKQTFSGLNIDVETGDFAGEYEATGFWENSLAGGSGYYGMVDDQFGAGQQTYTLFSDRLISIYGTGTTVAGIGAQYVNISPFGVTTFGSKTN